MKKAELTLTVHERNVIHIHIGTLKVGTITFNQKNITLQNIYEEQTTTWKDTVAIIEYIKNKHEKFLNEKP